MGGGSRIAGHRRPPADPRMEPPCRRIAMNLTAHSSRETFDGAAVRGFAQAADLAQARSPRHRSRKNRNPRVILLFSATGMFEGNKYLYTQLRQAVSCRIRTLYDGTTDDWPYAWAISPRAQRRGPDSIRGSTSAATMRLSRTCRGKKKKKKKNPPPTVSPPSTGSLENRPF